MPGKESYREKVTCRLHKKALKKPVTMVSDKDGDSLPSNMTDHFHLVMFLLRRHVALLSNILFLHFTDN
jgi:hypothetical protein